MWLTGSRCASDPTRRDVLRSRDTCDIGVTCDEIEEETRRATSERSDGWRAMVVGSLLGPQIADAASREDPRVERDQVRARQADVAANLNADKASIGEIHNALSTLQANVETQERGLQRAQDAVVRPSSARTAPTPPSRS